MKDYFSLVLLSVERLKKENYFGRKDKYHLRVLRGLLFIMSEFNLNIPSFFKTIMSP